MPSTAQDRLSNHAPFNFDLSVFDIFVAVKAGAAISLVPEGLSVFPVQLSSFIQDQRITVWYSVPMVLEPLAIAGKTGGARPEPAPVGSFRRRGLSDQTPAGADAKASSSAVCESLRTDGDECLRATTRWNRSHAEQSAPIPIGKACANTELIAIDANGRKACTAPGQEGTSLRSRLARDAGLLRTAITKVAACFISNPFASGRDEKLYCTGDWVTIDEKGNFLLIGRKDHMIKTRGYRVELG